MPRAASDSARACGRSGGKGRRSARCGGRVRQVGRFGAVNGSVRQESSSKFRVIGTIILIRGLVFSLEQIDVRGYNPTHCESKTMLKKIANHIFFKGVSLMSVIEVTNLTKYYGKSRGIVDVSFSEKEGEIFGFIGPNGAGKSTTICLLLSLIHPTSGSAKVFGKDVVAHGPEIRRDIGYLPSDVFYYEGMKVIDLLKYSASFYDCDCTQRMHELSEIMELEMNRRISDLSYGNKKKVGIVQGLLHSPKLLFLDEPTAGLDPLMQRKFFDLIRAENARGVTVFFSSHILGEVQRLCNRVGIIREGKIVEISDIRTLQQNNYKKVNVTADGLNPATFDLPGVTNLQTENGTLHFFFKGDINAVLQKISAIQVTDVTIEEPTLEEIFMHYYE